MRKLITYLLIAGILVFWYSAEAYAEYTGGSGDGWSYTTASPVMYHGGSADGHSMGTMASDITVGHGAISKLSFSASPSTGAYAGIAFDTQPVVEVLDVNDNVVLSATDTITLGINNDPPGGSALGGTISMAAVSGVADFSGKGLNINRAGEGFTLQAESGSLTSAVSSPFSIIPPIEVTSPNGGEVWMMLHQVYLPLVLRNS